MFRKIRSIIFKHAILLKYLIAGACATFTNLLVLFLLTGIFRIYYLFSSIIAFLIAFLVSFFLQKFWTFQNKDKKKIKKQAFLYLLVLGINLILNTLMMYIFVELFSFNYLLAQIIISLILALLSFFLYRIIFREKENLEKKKVKKILIASGIYPPDIGGPANYVKILEEELGKRDYSLKVITYADELSLKNGEDIEIVRIKREQNMILKYLKYFYHVFKLSFGADLIYVQGPISAGLPVFFASSLNHKKYILKIVGDRAWEYGKQKGEVKELLDVFHEKKYGFKIELMRFLEKNVAARAEKVIVPSEFLKSIVLKWGIEDSKIKVIYNAVRRAEVLENKQELREYFRIQGKTIISVGRLVAWKGFDALIEIMPDLLKINPDFNLLIAGDGPERKNLESRIKESNLEDSVKLLGNLEQGELWKYMKASDFFVLNTGYEGLPHLIIESMYLGLPVITTNIGGNPEVVQDGKNGILVEYNNKEEIKKEVLDLVQDEEKISLLKENALKSLDEKFSRDRMIGDLIGVVEGID